MTYTLTGFSPRPRWRTGRSPPSPIAGTIDPNALNPLVDGAYAVTLDNGKTASLSLRLPGGTPSGSYAAVAIFSYASTNQVDYFGSYAMAAVRVQ